MLLKKASKPQRKGFKRKKLDILGSYKEITKKVKEGAAAFANLPSIGQKWYKKGNNSRIY